MLRNEKFLDTEKIIDLLTSASNYVTHESIPRGAKNNVYFILNNRRNVERHLSGRHRTFDDDCGQWVSGKGRGNKIPYIKSSHGYWKRIFMYKG